MNHGVSDKRRIPCARKPDTHGFHPEDEACSYCCPEERSRSVFEDLQPPGYDPEYLWGCMYLAEDAIVRDMDVVLPQSQCNMGGVSAWFLSWSDKPISPAGGLSYTNCFGDTFRMSTPPSKEPPTGIAGMVLCNSTFSVKPAVPAALTPIMGPGSGYYWSHQTGWLKP